MKINSIHLCTLACAGGLAGWPQMSLADAPVAPVYDQAQLDQMAKAMATMQAQIKAMQAKLAAVRAKNATLEAQQETERKNQSAKKVNNKPDATKPSQTDKSLIQRVADAVAKKNAAPIKVGGAVRFNYTLEQFNQNSRNTVGDLNFD
ncbi:MAG: hypothetical protein B7X29_10250, partial [Halothiobacillus sp. 13-55-115]